MKLWKSGDRFCRRWRKSKFWLSSVFSKHRDSSDAKIAQVRSFGTSSDIENMEKLNGSLFPGPIAYRRDMCDSVNSASLALQSIHVAQHADESDGAFYPEVNATNNDPDGLDSTDFDADGDGPIMDAVMGVYERMKLFSPLQPSANTNLSVGTDGIVATQIEESGSQPSCLHPHACLFLEDSRSSSVATPDRGADDSRRCLGHDRFSAKLHLQPCCAGTTALSDASRSGTRRLGAGDDFDSDGTERVVGSFPGSFCTSKYTSLGQDIAPCLQTAGVQLPRCTRPGLLESYARHADSKPFHLLHEKHRADCGSSFPLASCTSSIVSPRDNEGKDSPEATTSCHQFYSVHLDCIDAAANVSPAQYSVDQIDCDVAGLAGEKRIRDAGRNIQNAILPALSNHLVSTSSTPCSTADYSAPCCRSVSQCVSVRESLQGCPYHSSCCCQSRNGNPADRLFVAGDVSHPVAKTCGNSYRLHGAAIANVGECDSISSRIAFPPFETHVLAPALPIFPCEPILPLVPISSCEPISSGAPIVRVVESAEDDCSTRCWDVPVTREDVDSVKIVDDAGSSMLHSDDLSSSQARKRPSSVVLRKLRMKVGASPFLSRAAADVTAHPQVSPGERKSRFLHRETADVRDVRDVLNVKYPTSRAGLSSSGLLLPITRAYSADDVSTRSKVSLLRQVFSSRDSFSKALAKQEGGSIHYIDGDTKSQIREHFIVSKAGSTASLPAGVLKSSHTSGQMTADSNLLRSFGQTSIHMSRDREVAKVLKKVFDKSEKGPDVKPPRNDRRTLKLSKDSEQGFGFWLQTYGLGKLKDGFPQRRTFVRFVEDEGPAYLAGLREGDIIVEVNGDNVEDLDHQQIVELIKGKDKELILVVKFLDAVRRVELSVRLKKRQAKLKIKLQELEDLVQEEKNVLKNISSRPDTDVEDGGFRSEPELDNTSLDTSYSSEVTSLSSFSDDLIVRTSKFEQRSSVVLDSIKEMRYSDSSINGEPRVTTDMEMLRTFSSSKREADDRVSTPVQVRLSSFHSSPSLKRTEAEPVAKHLFRTMSGSDVVINLDGGGYVREMSIDSAHEDIPTEKFSQSTQQNEKRAGEMIGIDLVPRRPKPFKMMSVDATKRAAGSFDM